MALRLAFISCSRSTIACLQDPYGFICNPADPPDYRPLTDGLSVDNYLQSMEHGPPLYMLQGAQRLNMVDAVEQIADQMKDQWDLTKEGWASLGFHPTGVASKLYKQVLQVMTEHHSLLHTFDLKKLNEENLCDIDERLPEVLDFKKCSVKQKEEDATDRAGEFYLTEAVLMKGALEYSRDFVLTSAITMSIAAHISQSTERLIEQCCEIDSRFKQPETSTQMAHVFEAQFRVIAESFNTELARAAREESVAEWPPLHLTDLCAWTRALDTVKRVDWEVWENALQDACKINSAQMSEAKLFLARTDDEQRMTRHRSTADEEGGVEVDDLQDAIVGFAAIAMAMEGDNDEDDDDDNDDDAVEDDYDDTNGNVTRMGDTAIIMKRRYRAQQESQYREAKAARKAVQKRKQAEESLTTVAKKSGQNSSDELIRTALVHLHLPVKNALRQHVLDLHGVLANAFLQAYLLHPPIRCPRSEALQISQESLTAHFNIIAAENDIETVRKPAKVVAKIADTAASCTEGLQVRFKCELFHWWWGHTSAASGDAVLDAMRKAPGGMASVFCVEPTSAAFSEAMTSMVCGAWEDYLMDRFVTVIDPMSNKDELRASRVKLLTSLAGFISAQQMAVFSEAVTESLMMKDVANFGSRSVLWGLACSYAHSKDSAWNASARDALTAMIAVESVENDYLLNLVRAIEEQTDLDIQKATGEATQEVPEMLQVNGPALQKLRANVESALTHIAYTSTDDFVANAGVARFVTEATFEVMRIGLDTVVTCWPEQNNFTKRRDHGALFLEDDHNTSQSHGSAMQWIESDLIGACDSRISLPIPASSFSDSTHNMFDGCIFNRTT